VDGVVGRRGTRLVHTIAIQNAAAEKTENYREDATMGRNKGGLAKRQADAFNIMKNWG